MAARGSFAKEQVANKVLQAFPGAFKHEKEIRIPVMENGELIQIKCVLTAAKVNVEAGSDTAVPGTITPVAQKPTATLEKNESKTLVEPTAEEKANVSKFLNMLGF